MQKRTFQKWVNMYLKPRGTHVTDLFTDLQDGVLLLQLLEQLSSEKLVRICFCFTFTIILFCSPSFLALSADAKLPFMFMVFLQLYSILKLG